MFNSKIFEDKSIKKKEELVNRSPLNLKLYKSVKNIFDKFDFLYAVMSNLDTVQRQESCNQSISKNKNCLNHTSMQDIFTFLATVSYLRNFKVSK